MQFCAREEMCHIRIEGEPCKPCRKGRKGEISVFIGFESRVLMAYHKIEEIAGKTRDIMEERERYFEIFKSGYEQFCYVYTPVGV